MVFSLMRMALFISLSLNSASKTSTIDYYADFHFTGALREYITLSIDDALQSSNSLIQAVAMFDRRLGKRRLQKMTENPPEHPLVNAFFRLRCEAEGINTT
jgi:hypothetical protein